MPVAAKDEKKTTFFSKFHNKVYESVFDILIKRREAITRQKLITHKLSMERQR